MLVSPVRLMSSAPSLHPTMDLSFLSGVLDSRLTFTRASAGWYFSSAGVLTSAAIDAPRFDCDFANARTNLALRSAEQDNSGVWTAAQVTVTANTIANPVDAAVTADTFTENSTSLSRGTAQAVTIATNVSQSLSVYAKAGTRSWLRLMLNTGSDSVLAWFNLGTGVVGSTAVEGTGSSPTSAITAVGTAGWYRCTLTGIPSSSNSGSIGAYIRMATADSEFSYQGDGTGTLHVWGAQLETGAATAYIATTSAAVTVCAPLGLLIEEARTNLFQNSATGVTQTRTVTAVAHTLSFYGTGTITLSGTSTAGPLVGTGTNARVTLTFTPTAGSLTLTVSGTCTNVNLEIGAFATSPIITAGASVTRAADVCTMATSSIPGFNAAAGTLFAEGARSTLGATVTFPWLAALDGTSGNRMGIFHDDPGNDKLKAIVRVGGVTQANFTTGGPTLSTVGDIGRGALAYALNDFAYVGNNNTSVATDTSGTVPTVTALLIGSGDNVWCGWVRRIAYYNKRLPNAVLLRITT